MDKQTFLVTGAAKPGYGEETTKRIIAEGNNVIGTYEAENKETAEQLLTEYTDSHRLELSMVSHQDRSKLAEFVQTITVPLSGIVHGQFFFDMENTDDFDHAIWDTSIAVNLTAVNYLTHELKHLLTDSASIVVVTSTEGLVGSFGASAYAATKAAIHNLVKTFANNLGHRHIRANAIAAGWIGGVMDTDEVFNMSRQITPLGRLGDPKEIAAVVWFLLSSQSSFVNGTTIIADGGYSGVDTIAKYEFEHSKLG